MKRAIKALLLFVIVALGAFTAYQAVPSARADADYTERTVTNETITQDTGNWTAVAEADDRFTVGFNDAATVYNQSNTELTAGTDYEWNATDGTIKFFSTAKTTDGNSATITYTYHENTAEVQTGTEAVDVAVGSLWWLGLPLFIVFLIAMFVFLARSAERGANRLGGRGR